MESSVVEIEGVREAWAARGSQSVCRARGDLDRSVGLYSAGARPAKDIT